MDLDFEDYADSDSRDFQAEFELDSRRFGVPFHPRRMIFDSHYMLGYIEEIIDDPYPIIVFGGSFKHLDGTTLDTDDQFAWAVAKTHGMVAAFDLEGRVLGWLYPGEFRLVEPCLMAEGSTCLH